MSNTHNADYALNALDIERATNLFGKLGTEVKTRLRAVINNPSSETWDDAYSIILNARTGTTLWQAVIAADPSFLKTGTVSSPSGRAQWAAVPTRETLLDALRYAVEPPVVVCDRDPGTSDGPGSYHHGEHEETSSCHNPKPTQNDSSGTP